jgi:hypothetical protein
LDYLAYRAYDRQRSGGRLLAYSLLDASALARLDHVTVQVRFSLGGRTRSGALVLTRLRGSEAPDGGDRWVEVRWDERATRNTRRQHVDTVPLALRLVVDPPGLVFDTVDAFGAGLEQSRSAVITGSDAALTPPRFLELPEDGYFHARRAAMRRVLHAHLQKPWTREDRPIAFDALALVDHPALRPYWKIGASLALHGGDRLGQTYVDNRETEPTQLVLHPPPHGEGGAMARMWLDVATAESRDEGLPSALRRALRSDLETALLSGRASLSDDLASKPAAWSVPTLKGREWAKAHSWTHLEQAANQWLEREARARFGAWILQPTRNRHHAGLPVDNATAERLFEAHFARNGAPAAGGTGWTRAIIRLLLTATTEPEAEIERLIASYRGAGAKLELRTDPDRPLTLLYDKHGRTARETWRWLLPRGSLIRRGVNRLDDDFCPLDIEGGLYLE